jgi:hypothetical protein
MTTLLGRFRETSAAINWAEVGLATTAGDGIAIAIAAIDFHFRVVVVLIVVNGVAGSDTFAGSALDRG